VTGGAFSIFHLPFAVFIFIELRSSQTLETQWKMTTGKRQMEKVFTVD
jgi:hypothetical protein